MQTPGQCYYRWEDNTLWLEVIVQPRASLDKIVGEYNGQLKIQITAPPVDGKANNHLCRYLAKVFKVARSHITIVSGESGRHKKLKILNPQQLPEWIREAS